MLYGVYPYVVEKLDALLSTGAQFGFHVSGDASLRRLDCHVVSGADVKTFVLVVVPKHQGWEHVLLKDALHVLACVTSRGGLTTVSISDNIRMGRALATLDQPVMPLVSRRFDLVWLRDLLARHFLKEFSGLEHFGIPEYFRFRLSAVISDEAFDRRPVLRRVRFMRRYFHSYVLVFANSSVVSSSFCFFVLFFGFY